MFKTANRRLFYLIIILSSFFGSCEDEPEAPKQQFAVRRGATVPSVWVDVYRSGSVEIFIASNTGEPDATMQLDDEQLNAMDAMEADFGDYLSNYPSVVCSYDGDFTYRVILKTTLEDTIRTCGTTDQAIPQSLSAGLNVINELINSSY